MKNGDYDLAIAPIEYTGKKYKGRYIPESHLVWWEYTGEIVKFPHLIHHKNNNKHDNKFKNLKKRHIQKHNFEHNYLKDIKVKCKNCNKLFKLIQNDFRRRKKINKYRLFCNRSCGTTYQYRVI